MNKYLRSTLAVLAGFSILTVIMTWPVIRYFGNAIPGDGFDGWQNYWNLWWVKQALLVEQTNPFFTTYLDAPSGVSLLFHTLNIFNGLWTLPIQLNWGLAVAYNSVVILSFVLAGFGGYLLALDTLTRVYPNGVALRPAAFIAGLIFTMSPFHMAHLLGHMQVFSMIWPPFYVLWLLRTLTPQKRPGIPSRQWRNAAMCILFLVLATLVDWYHTLYLLFFTALVLVWVLWQNRNAVGERHQRLDLNPFFGPIIVVATIVLGFGLLLSPLLVPMVQEASTRPDLDTGLDQNITLSADLVAFLLPSELHPVWGTWAKQIADNFTSTTSERLIFAGFTPLILTLIALVGGWRRSAVKFWVLIVGVFVILAIGPYLHVNGKIVTIGSWQLPMPYLLLYYTVPFINLTRSLSRYDLMVMLGIGVLSAIGLALLTEKYRVKPAIILPVGAGLLICLEFLAAPFPVSSINIPQFYTNIAADIDDYTIAELPMNWDRPTPLLHQTVHGKKLLTSYTSRDNPLELAWRTPVFQHWQQLGPDIIDQPIAEIAPTIFYDFNLRYVVLDYWQMPTGPERDGTERWVQEVLTGTPPVYEDGRLKVYKTPPQTRVAPYLSLGNGWSPLLITEFGHTRSIVDQAELFGHHLVQPNQLEITGFASEASEAALQIFHGDQLLTTLRLTAEPTPHNVLLPEIDGLLKLTLVTDRPVAISRIRLVTDAE
jgi:hypothetical protein